MADIGFKDGDIGWKNSDVVWDGVSATILDTAGLDALVKKTGVTQSASADALIQRAGVYSSALLDAIAKELGVTDASDLAALVKQLGNTSSAEADGLIQKSQSISGGLGALLLKLKRVTAVMDARLGKVYTIGSGLDSIAKKSMASTSSVDAVIFRDGTYDEVFLQAIVKRVDITIGVLMDAVLKNQWNSTPIVLNARIQAQRAILSGINAIIQAGSRTTSGIFNAVIKKSQALSVELDAILRVMVGASANLDALMQSPGLHEPVDMDALIKDVSSAVSASISAAIVYSYLSTSGLSAVITWETHSTAGMDAGIIYPGGIDNQDRVIRSVGREKTAYLIPREKTVKAPGRIKTVIH